MAGIQDYSTTAGSNTSLMPENINVGLVNNRYREGQTHLRAWYNDSAWVEYGDGNGAGDGTTVNYTIAYVGPTQFTITGDVTSAYVVGRKIRATVDAGNYIYGIINASSYSNPSTTVTVAWLDTTLTSGTLRVWLGADSGDPETTALSGAAFTGQDMSPRFKGPTETVQLIPILSGVVTFDVADGGVIRITLDANLTAWTITWPSGASSFFVEMTQNATGNWTVAWPAAWTWPAGTEPTMTAAATAVDMFAVASFDGGATVRAQAAGQGYA